MVEGSETAYPAELVLRCIRMSNGQSICPKREEELRARKVGCSDTDTSASGIGALPGSALAHSVGLWGMWVNK